MTDTKVERLHDQIMRLPCTPPAEYDEHQNVRFGYKIGHRDARHAAAELAAAHEAEQATPVAVPDELRAKAENFVTRMRRGSAGDRAAERELEDEDADEAQACAVQAYIQEDAAAMVEQLLSAVPTPPVPEQPTVKVSLELLGRIAGFHWVTDDHELRAKCRVELRALLEGGDA